MLRFFGLSKRKKIKVEEAIDLYVSVLNEVIENGFIEIKDFINNNNNLESNPDIKDEDVKWFRMIILLGNLNLLGQNFESQEAIDIRVLILDRILSLIDKNLDLAMEQFLHYEDYFKQLLSENEDVPKTMAIAIFEKYNINDYQGDLFKRKNTPNPVFLHELKNLLRHFIWNWEDYLKKYKINF